MFNRFCKLMLLPESTMSPPDTTWLFWLEDWTWPIICEAKLSPMLPTCWAICCARPLFPEFCWFWMLVLLQESWMFPAETHCEFWLEDWNWPIPCEAKLPILLPPPPPCCARPLFPEFCWFWMLVLLQESWMFPAETHCEFWLEDWNWPIPCEAKLPLPSWFSPSCSLQ